MGKTMKVYVALVIWLCIAVSATQATDGRLFLLSFLNLSPTDPTRKGFNEITLSSTSDANFRAVIPGANITVFGSLNATNNRRWQITIAEDLALPKGADMTKVGILISSDKQISVQASQAQAGQTDGYTALPITQGAKEFFVPSWAFTAIGPTVSHSNFAITSLFDGTCTEVYRILADGTYVRLWFLGLEEIDVFQAFTDTDDFSGIYINSTKPIAVVGGHECAQVPHGIDYCDHLIEQIPPVVDWGKEHIVGPIDGRNKAAGYYIRVYSANDTTQVTATVSDVGQGGGVLAGSGTSVDTVTVSRGQFKQFLTSNSMTAVIVTCSEPCMVVQYNPSMLVVGSEVVNTDAFMTIIPPLDRYKNEYSFGTSKYFYDPKTSGVAAPYYAVEAINYVTVIVRTTDVSTITLDGTSSLTFNPIVNRPGYSVATRTVNPGIHIVRSSSPNGEMVVFVYGHGIEDHTAYGYIGGYTSDDAEIVGDFYNITALQMNFQSPIIGGGGGGTVTTTLAPDVSTPTTDWLSLVRADEYPTYMVELGAKFYNVERDGKLIERKCTEIMLDQLRDTRMPAMEAELNNNLLQRYCGTTAMKAKLTDGTLYTEYSRGSLSVTIEFTGTKDMTFRSLKACAENISPHLSELKNWPNPDPYFLHIIRPNTITHDCDPVYFEEKFKETLVGWKCDLNLGSVSGDSAPLAPLSRISMGLLALFTFVYLRLSI